GFRLRSGYDTPRPFETFRLCGGGSRHRLPATKRTAAHRCLHVGVPPMGLEHHRQEHVAVGVFRPRAPRDSGTHGLSEMSPNPAVLAGKARCGIYRLQISPFPILALQPRCTSRIRPNEPGTWTKRAASSILPVNSMLPMSGFFRTSSSRARTSV